jgi:AcrR family transcriptional regulator
MVTDRNTQDPDPVLDAAHATVLDFGISRATLTEVARRAGLSRMTVYRRYEDATALIRALMTREFGALLEAAPEDLGSDPLGAIVDAVVGTVDRLTLHPLLLRLLELEPEVVLPYLIDRVGAFPQAARGVLAREITTGQQAGAIRAGNPELMAATVELLARGPVLAARSLEATDRARMLDELGYAVRAYLKL